MLSHGTFWKNERNVPSVFVCTIHFLESCTSLNYAQHLKAELIYLGVSVIKLNYSFVSGELEI